jgi:hypothetical protein
LGTKWETPTRSENEPTFIDDQITAVSKIAIDAVVEIDGEIRALGVTRRYHGFCKIYHGKVVCNGFQSSLRSAAVEIATTTVVG